MGCGALTMVGCVTGCVSTPGVVDEAAAVEQQEAGDQRDTGGNLVASLVNGGISSSTFLAKLP